MRAPSSAPAVKSACGGFCVTWIDSREVEGGALLKRCTINAGPGSVDAAGGVPSYEETLQYIYTVEAEGEAILARLPDDGASIEIDSPVSVPDNSIPSEKDKQRFIQDTKPTKKVIQPPTIRVWPTTASEERDDQTAKNGIGIFRK